MCEYFAAKITGQAVARDEHLPVKLSDLIYNYR